LGLSDEVIDLAWPSWWSDEAELSASARAELRFVVARRLGLDAIALVDNDEPHFVWKAATFKNLSAITDAQRAAITSYGTSLARTILSAVPETPGRQDLGALGLRARLLSGAEVVSLQDVLSLCWALGIPVMHLKVFPLKAKHMCAMAVRVRDRYAIILARKSNFPSQIAYYIGHELGHIALDHLASHPAVVDLEDPLGPGRGLDEEEAAADRYALELLTGQAAPQVLTEARRFSAASLAEAVRVAGPQLHIDPGILALCFGHNTGIWNKVFAALKLIYPQSSPVGTYVNRVAFSQLEPGILSEEGEDYLRSATGET
jgi:hypothetical protein